MTGNPPTPFTVVYSEKVRGALRELCVRASQQGIGAEVLRALRAIDQRLRDDARNFGEPKYTFRALQLELRVGIETPLVIHYTVHTEQPLVFVRHVNVLPGQGL